jgi:hypothetical protein
VADAPLERIEAPQVMVVDDEQHFEARNAACPTEHLQETLHVRPVVERGPEIVEHEQRPRHRRGRHALLGQRRAVDIARGHAARLQGGDQPGAHQRRLADAGLAEDQRARAVARQLLAKVSDLALATEEQRSVRLCIWSERTEGPGVVHSAREYSESAARRHPH